MTVGPVGDEEVVADRDAGGPDRLDLGEQRLEVDDDARTDDGPSVPRKMPAGSRCSAKRRVAELDGVSGVVASVVARDDVETVGEQVHDLALALVAPLSAQDGQDLHVVCSSLRPKNSAA